MTALATLGERPRASPADPTMLAAVEVIRSLGNDPERGLSAAEAGMRTELGRIATLLEHTEVEPTPLQREIALVGRTLGLAVVAIAVIVVATVIVTAHISTPADLLGVLLLGVSLAVAAVPEGLPAILTVVLALGVQRMARRNALGKKLSSVETLGSASVIGTDKTGTLTRNEMTSCTSRS